MKAWMPFKVIPRVGKSLVAEKEGVADEGADEDDPVLATLGKSSVAEEEGVVGDAVAGVDPVPTTLEEGGMLAQSREYSL